jgi:hypothetical protein
MEGELKLLIGAKIPPLKDVMDAGNITGANSIFLSDILSAPGANAYVLNTVNNFEGLFNPTTISDRAIFAIQNQTNTLFKVGRVVDNVGGTPVTINFLGITSAGTSTPLFVGSV